jgi:hypothetical protein
MAIDYSVLALPKGTPKAVLKDQRTAQRQSVDERENVKVRARSGGRCEVVVGSQRCKKRANQVHHQIGGSGKRARGKSLLADHKQHACHDCHSAITSHRLFRLGAAVPQWSDKYRKAV